MVVFNANLAGANDRVIEGLPLSPINLYLDYAERRTVLDPSFDGEQTIGPAIYDYQEAADVLVEGDVIVTGDDGEEQAGPLQNVEYIAMNPEVGTVDQNGRVTRVTDGVAQIRVMAGTYPKRTGRDIYVPVQIENGAEAWEFNRYVPGTIIQEMGDFVDTRLAGKDPAVAKPMWSVQDHDNGIYVRNPQNWAYDIRHKMSCIFAASMNPGINYPWYDNFGLIKIADDIALTAGHVLWAYGKYGASDPSKVRFVTGDNEVVEMTVHSGSWPAGDLGLVRFTENIPESIYTARMLPDDFWDYCGRDPNETYGPTTSTLIHHGAAAFRVNQFCQLIPSDFWFYGQPNGVVRFTTFGPSPHADRAAFQFDENVIPGDSGTATVTHISDQLCFVGTATGGGNPTLTRPGPGTGIGGSGAMWPISTLQSAIAALGSSATLTMADLSAWTNYED